MSVTSDTRFDSFQSTNRKRLYQLITSVLKEYSEGMTAREIAIKLYNQGFLLSNERQATAPRLTEMVDKGLIVVVGKKKDTVTQKQVAVYAIK